MATIKTLICRTIFGLIFTLGIYVIGIQEGLPADNTTNPNPGNNTAREKICKNAGGVANIEGNTLSCTLRDDNGKQCSITCTDNGGCLATGAGCDEFSGAYAIDRANSPSPTEPPDLDTSGQSTPMERPKLDRSGRCKYPRSCTTNSVFAHCAELACDALRHGCNSVGYGHGRCYEISEQFEAAQCGNADAQVPSACGGGQLPRVLKPIPPGKKLENPFQKP